MLALTWLLSTVISFSISQDHLNILLEKKFKPPSNAVSDPAPGHCQPSPVTLNVWWISIPPFVTQKTKTSGTDATAYDIKGIFPDILKLAIDRCYAIHNECKRVIFIQLPVHNQSVLLEDIKTNKDFLLIPVESDEEGKYKGYFTVLKLLESPGTVLIKREEDSITRSIVQMWSTAILNCWPIIALSVSLSFVAGIAVWALVSNY